MNQITNDKIPLSRQNEKYPLIKRKREEAYAEADHEHIIDLCDLIYKDFETLVYQITWREPVIFTAAIPDKIHRLDKLLTQDTTSHLKEMQIKICEFIHDRYLQELNFYKEDYEAALPSSIIPYINSVDVEKINEYMQQKFIQEKTLFKNSCPVNSYTYIPVSRQTQDLISNEETFRHYCINPKFVDKKTSIDACEKEINTIINLIKLNETIENTKNQNKELAGYKMLYKFIYSNNPSEFVATYPDKETKEKWQHVLPFLFPSFCRYQNQYVPILPKQRE